MAITRLAVSTPSADTDTLIHTAARSAVESVIVTNKNSTSAVVSVWVVPYGQDANSDNWVYIASNVTVEASNAMETFRFPAVSFDKIYIRSSQTNVSFSLNALYEVNGTSNITVQSTAPSSPQLGDVWVDSDDNVVYYWNDSSWISSTYSEITLHSADTTSVHGISDTANLVYTNDSRLSDARTPTSHASTHTSGGSDEITVAQSQVTNLSTDLSSKAPLASPTFTGTVTLPSDTSIGNVSSTEISYVDGVTSSIQSQLDSKATSATIDDSVNNHEIMLIMGAL